MILVDTSIWIDHLHRTDSALVELLNVDSVGVHPFVIEELALGSIKQRETVLGLLENLTTFPVLNHTEVRAFVEARRLWGRGLSAIGVHLLGSVTVVPGARLWTRDKRLAPACDLLEIAVRPE